jgi:hypothetical protein
MSEKPRSIQATPDTSPGAPISAITNDELVSALLAKRGRGEKLSAAEHGKLGAWSAKTGSKLPGRPPKPPLVPAALPPGPAAGLPQGPAGPLGDPASDSIVKDTTAAILATVDSLAVGYIESAARDAGADQARAEKLAGSCKLQDEAKRLMVDTSPAVAAAFGVDVRHYPIGAFAAGACMYVGGIGMVIKELRDMKRQQLAMERKRHFDERQKQAAQNSGMGGV